MNYDLRKAGDVVEMLIGPARRPEATPWARLLHRRTGADAPMPKRGKFSSGAGRPSRIVSQSNSSKNYRQGVKEGKQP
jgi:hypothetical protein